MRNISEKAERQIAEMKKQTIGVEIEMYGITREKAAKVAAKFFGTNNYKDTSGRNGYSTWSAWDAQSREWKFQKDVSIISNSEATKCELTTPILKYEDIETLQALVRKLRRAGAKSDPKHECGIHVHIGANGQNGNTIRNLVNIMAAHETLLVNAIKIANNRLSRWCKVINDNFLRRVNEEKPATLPELADVWYNSQGCSYGRNSHYNSSRYHILNLHATFTKGTIEFRCFQFDNPTEEKKNGLHAGQLKAYIQLCLALCQKAKDVKWASPKKVQIENPRYAMNSWMFQLNMVGDEFKTARNFFNGRLSGRLGRRCAGEVFESVA